MHTPVEVDVEVFEDVGGILVGPTHERQIRCGCETHLGFDWGHHEERT